MGALAVGIRFVDLQFLGIPEVIATAVLDGPHGVTLVDPGPSSCLPELHRQLRHLGIGVQDLTSILLTHIHLDHAGATGGLLREQPRLRVFVHERGAPHLVDPSRLLESATRLYGDQMERLWGEVLPVPSDSVQVLRGGETVRVGGRELEVAYTPGHASHHVWYFDASSTIAFVGDTCGVRIGPSSFVMPPTPPPDIDLDAWSTSLDRIQAWTPRTLFLTHFGPREDPAPHIASLRQNLDLAARLARDYVARYPDPSRDAEVALEFAHEFRHELSRYLSEQELRRYEVAIPPLHWYLGLARYWRKKSQKT